MIFTEKRWDGGYLVVCGSLWPGADQGAPMPEGYPDRWRTGQPPAKESHVVDDTNEGRHPSM